MKMMKVKYPVGYNLEMDIKRINKPEDAKLNVKLHMQSEAYVKEKELVQSMLNKDSQAWNIKTDNSQSKIQMPTTSNLVEPHKVGKQHHYYKDKSERNASKKAKYQYKLNPNKGRDEVVAQIVGFKNPKFNIVVKFIK